ncbi:MAG TPA: GNAT family N-acetyltransferase [Gaiellaceae bacterium]
MIELPLETRRLRVRPFRPGQDAAAMHELWGDPEAMRFVPGSLQQSLEGTRARLARTLKQGRDGFGFWALELRESGRLVGAVGLFPLGWEGPEIELAYHIVPSAWNQGYASEAGGALLEAAWRETELDRVVAVALPENRASTRVMEKLGLTYEGPERYRGFDVVRYSIGRPPMASPQASL